MPIEHIKKIDLNAVPSGADYRLRTPEEMREDIKSQFLPRAIEAGFTSKQADFLFTVFYSPLNYYLI